MKTLNNETPPSAPPDAPAFSLLMAVYGGNTLREFERALQSGTIEQTLPPRQVVIVRDGPVSVDLERFLQVLQPTVDTWFASDSHGFPAPEITLVELENNCGLAHALNIGLRHCSYELVARADCDDISLPERFAKTIPLLAGGKDSQSGNELEVVSSAIQEFNGDDDEMGQIRMLPENNEDLARYARLQSPIHHPSSAFRKSAVLQAGGYPEDIGRFEDYMLWEKMMLGGSKMMNVPEALVLYRTDDDAYHRRGGWQMFREELRLQRHFLHDHFITPWQFLRNVMMRAAYRLAPTSIRKRGYHKLVDRHNHQLEDRQAHDTAASAIHGEPIQDSVTPDDVAQSQPESRS